MSVLKMSPFSLLKQICCSGLLHTKKSHHHCCNEDYFSWNDSSIPVCCNGKLVPSRPDYQCCGRYYVLLKAGMFSFFVCTNIWLIIFTWFESSLLNVAQVLPSSVLVFSRWILLSWPLAGPGLCGAWWQLLWGGSLFHDRRPALLQWETTWWL